MNEMTFSGVCLLADGFSPIGRKTGARLAQAGARVVACCRKDVQPEERSLPALEVAGAPFRVEQVDFTDIDSIRAMVARVEGDQRFGSIDAMFYNIEPPFIRQHIIGMTSEQVDGMIDRDVTGAFLATKVIGEAISRRHGGSMVYLGSLHDDKPTGIAPLTSMYMGALKNMSREAAMFYGTDGVRCNLIELGAVGGEDLQYRGGISKFYEGYNYKIPSGYVGGASDVAGLALFLMSDQGRYINGAEIRMDGGLLLQYVDIIANANALAKEGRNCDA